MTVTPRSSSPSTITQHFYDLLGTDSVTPFDGLDSTLHNQISRAIAPPLSPDTQPACIIFPKTQDELVEAVACAHINRWVMMPMGSGSKLHWGGLAQPVQVLVSTSRLTQIIDHAIGDLTITAEAGATFGAIAHTLHQANQQLGIDPAYPDRATLGGIIATGSTGSLRQRYGSVRDMLIGISFVRADGTLAKAGGRVVKNVAGYDLMKLMTGSYGTVGIISQCTFRVYPQAETSKTVVLTGDANAIQSLAATVLASSLTPQRFDLISAPLIRALGLRRESRPQSSTHLGLLVQFQSLAISVDQQVQQMMTLAAAHSIPAECLDGEPETALWKQLREQMDNAPTDVPITCKMGVLANQAAATLAKLPELLPVEAIAQIHASSGLGTVRLEGGAIAPQSVLRLRQWCESHNGFLTVLEAPPLWKQQIDVWGYPGNALSVMQRIKQQFDPNSLLNPARFVGDI